MKKPSERLQELYDELQELHDYFPNDEFGRYIQSLFDVIDGRLSSGWDNEEFEIALIAETEERMIYLKEDIDEQKKWEAEDAERRASELSKLRAENMELKQKLAEADKILVGLRDGS